MQSDLLIRNLSRDVKPRVSVLPSQRALLSWLIFTIGCLGIGVGLHAVRDDAMTMLEHGSYYFELFSALTLAIVAAGSALNMRIPGSKAPLKVLTTLSIVWLLSLIYHAVTMDLVGASFNRQSELLCMGSIILFGTLPALFLYQLVRRGATTEPSVTMALIAVAFTSAGAAFLPLACENDGLIHLLLGHASPVVIAGALGWVTGRSFLRW